jgi:ankyrin repeat protein
VDNNFLYQTVMFFSAVAGCLGVAALLAHLPWLPLWLVGSLAIFLGGLYGWIQAEVVCQFPRLRERWVVTSSYKPGLSDRPGCLDVFAPFACIAFGVLVMAPVFQQAREKAQAARHPHQLRSNTPGARPVGPPLSAALVPVALTGIVAAAGWRLHATRHLYHMAMEGDVEGARRLLDQGADPEGLDRYVGCPPLIWAIREYSANPDGQAGVARLLLERGADPDHEDRDGVAPVVWAASRQRTEILTALLAHGADPNRPDPRPLEECWPRQANGRTPLMIAAPFPDLVRALLAVGADIHARDSDGATALMHAARGCNWTHWLPAMSAESISLLVRRGAEVDARDHQGRTPLIACANSAVIVGALLDAGAAVNAVDANGMTPLMAAAGHAASWVPGEDESPGEVIRLLLARGADPDAWDASGRTALQIAREKKLLDVVDLLISLTGTID